MSNNKLSERPSDPFFSILIPTKNRPALTRDLINTILSQDFKDFELIVADNSTSSETQALLGDITDQRLINFRTGDLNMADNWELGMDQCSGNYLLLFSDKMLLKVGALSYLADYIKKNSPNCVNWDIDSYFDDECCFSKCKPTEIDNTIDSKELLKAILSSEFDSTRLPCHCNSAISMDLIGSIKSKMGRVSMQLNPDYTLSYQVFLNTEKIHNLNQSLSILRYPNFKEGYGTGTSQMMKGEQGELFMMDNADWVERTNKYNDVRIKSNNFGLDTILKDLYYILETYQINPDSILLKEERYINYYYFTYLEIIFRINMGSRMNSEMNLWKECLKKELNPIRVGVIRKTSKLRFRLLYVRFKRLLTLIPLVSNLIHIIGDLLYRRDNIYFNSLEECLSKIVIPEVNLKSRK